MLNLCQSQTDLLYIWYVTFKIAMHLIGHLPTSVKSTGQSVTVNQPFGIFQEKENAKVYVTTSTYFLINLLLLNAISVTFMSYDLIIQQLYFHLKCICN